MDRSEPREIFELRTDAIPDGDRVSVRDRCDRNGKPAEVEVSIPFEWLMRMLEVYEEELKES